MGIGARKKEKNPEICRPRCNRQEDSEQAAAVVYDLSNLDTASQHGDIALPTLVVFNDLFKVNYGSTVRRQISNVLADQVNEVRRN